MDKKPGPKSRSVFHEEQAVVAPGQQRIALLSELTLASGRGATITDLDGNTYLDFFAGVAVASLGHAHPAYMAKVEAQLRRISVGSFTTENRLKLLRLIAKLAPGNLARTQLFSGGAEAVEAAFRLAMSATGKYEIVGFWGGFHGKTAGVMGLIGDESKHGWGPLPGGRFSVPYADCARCPFKLRHPDCGLACADFARQAIKRTTSGAVAAIVIEPMQGTAGNVVPPPEFLPAIQSIAKEIGALLIADEMITGFGRTGRWFGCNHSNVVPDVMTVGKGMGNGFPISGVISSDDIVRAEPFSRASASSSSYGGNPLAATAALATLEAMVDEGLVEHAATIGAHMLDRLRAMRETYPFIGDVRGAGLMIGVDLVADRSTNELLGRAATERIFLDALQHGLLMMGYFPRIRINPPLTITREQADRGLDILDRVFARAAKEVPAS
ncbi:MAG: aspartate aminotransferase family protein [Deltaproteobacteria bacterium]|nr:aspartate aminotransferase family protein [Deltaproteobacteria bacterium]